MRVFFATDIHGSDICWRKFLNSGQHYDADVIVLGGDMTGKALIPVVDNGNDSWYSSLLENRYDLSGEDEVREYEAGVRRRGYYPFRTTPDELRELPVELVRVDALLNDPRLHPRSCRSSTDGRAGRPHQWRRICR